MSVIRNVGGVSVSSKKLHWTIPNFFDLPQMYDSVIESPSFQFVSRKWYLYIYPNGLRNDSSFGWFGIAADTDTPFTSNECDIHFAIADEHGRSIVSCRAEEYNNGWYESMTFLSHAQFIWRKNVFVPNGTLHVLLSVVNEEAESTFHAGVNKVEDKVCKVKQDLEKMLLSESITDVVLTVQGQQFRAHRCILAARSPVFFAMMNHDTKEKATGVVDIQDGDPNTFSDFLHFLYTGKVNNFTLEKALKLFYIADKYQVNDLKQKCSDHLLTSISVENFCDIFFLSFQHNETHLKDVCIQFFLDNSLDIVLTKNWQTFLSENPIIGNELFIKHLQLIKSLYCEK